MTRLWVKIIHRHRIIAQETVPCGIHEAQSVLQEVCSRLDIPNPIWLSKNENEFDAFRRTIFRKDHFMEDIRFDMLEIEFIEDADKKRKSNDPRNQFDLF